MKVILLKDIPKIGNKDDVKDFKEGYAQNVLLSKGLAIIATPHNLLLLNTRKEKITKQKEEEQKDFTNFLESINNTFTIKVLANEKNHLFKAINKKDIVEAISKEISSIHLNEESIEMDPIKEIGSHQIKIKKWNSQKVININVIK